MDELYKTKYEELLKEHNKLKHEFSENIIIQSMNSMKEVYDEKVNEYNLLNEKYNNFKNLYNNKFNQLETQKLVLEKSEEYLLKKKKFLEENIKAVVIMIYTLKDKISYNNDFTSKLQFIEDILYNALY